MNEEVFRQVADLVRSALSLRKEESVLNIFEAIERDERRLANSFLSERQQIDSPYTGVRFTVVEVGKVILALSGTAALIAIVQRIEAEIGERESVWLARRWSALTGSASA